MNIVGVMTLLTEKQFEPAGIKLVTDVGVTCSSCASGMLLVSVCEATPGLLHLGPLPELHEQLLDVNINDSMQACMTWQEIVPG